MKILIIEDEKEIITFLTKSLASESFLVESAEDGERGSFMARTSSYDLIILDSALPKLSGPAVIKEIRDEKCNTPIIMLSVKAEINDKEEAYRLGADDYLTKPFLLQELLLKIKALLRRPARLEPRSIKFGDLTFNQEAGLFKRGNKEIYLTKKEYGLLEYLFKRRNEIVSRGEILENVWDYNADPFSNSVETHITSLRKKLNAENKKNIIHTFSGRGYKLSTKRLI